MMNLSSAGNRRKLVDLLGIGLLFMAGIPGLIFVFYPVTALPPKLPLLSRRHLPGSQLVARLRMPGDGQQDKREYFLRMQIAKSRDYSKDVTIWQYTTWYADRSRPAVEWENDYREMSSRFETIPRTSSAIDKPESVLYCPYQRNSPLFNFYEQNCTYLAFRGHWYTEVILYSRGEEYLSQAEIQKIVDHVDELLLAAPDTP